MSLRIAVIHDWLVGIRGGEKVLEEILSVIEKKLQYDKLEIYTLVHKKESQSEIVEKQNINTSFIQHLPFGLKKYRNYLPFFPSAIESFNLKDFNLIISSSHAVAKGVIPPVGAVHISYSHTPMRYIWDHYHTYFGNKRGLKRIFYSTVASYLRIWDRVSSDRVDYFIANSENVRRRIERYYRRNSEVIYPPVDTDFFLCDEKVEKKDYFLLVSAMVPYKRVDLAIKTFNKNGLPLKVVGDGPDFKKLKKIAKDNIEFLGRVNNSELKILYSESRALIFPAEEDFGIIPVEAQACGTPVIAYGKGGALETIVDEETGLFFDRQTEEALLLAIDKFLNKRFNSELIRKNSLRFSKKNFREKFSLFIERVMRDRKSD